MAVHTAVSICNMALSRIGIGQQIQELADTDDVEKVCGFWYPIVLDRILESFDWPFANKKVELGLVEEDPDEADGDWNYSYRYPNTCLLALRIVSGLGTNESIPVPFRLGQDATGRLIYTNQQDAVLQGVFWYTDPGEFPNIFTSALAWDLASEIAMPLSVDRSKADRAVAMRDQELMRAKGTANRERRLMPSARTPLVAARFGLPTSDLPLRES